LLWLTADSLEAGELLAILQQRQFTGVRVH